MIGVVFMKVLIKSREMLSRLCENWVYGGFLAAILLLVLTPILARDWPIALLLIWLQLPVYMLHQYEEHDHDRFRQFVNESIGNGKEMLSRFDVFIINIIGVWGIDSLSFYLAGNVYIGLGLIAVYLSLINGVGHCMQAIVLRCYNPGLITSIVLFIPLGIITLYVFITEDIVRPLDHMIGIVSALVIHGLVILRVLQNKIRYKNA